MKDNDHLPVKILLLVSLLQGLALLFLHQAIELKFWPHSSPQWLFSFYSMALVGPVMLLLGLKQQQELAVAKWVLPFTLLCGLLGYYVGFQATPLVHIPYGSLLLAFCVTMSIATFKALMYIQQFVSGEKFSYTLLFSWSWRNFLTLALSLLFAACCWGLLMLWAGLFKAIKIDFFYDLFTERWFFYPIIALANGFGVVIFRNLSHIIDTITRLQQALMKYLLILLVLVSFLFLGALPVTGLSPLWETGGSHLILWMQAIMLFFLNAVYQDDPDSRPYSVWLHRFIYCGVALLPIYSAISFYGLSLRIDQYGWSVARCWAILIWLLLALFSTGYLWGIIRHRDNWLHNLSKVNVSMGLTVLVFMLLVNSPILDFRKITVNSQLQRLDSDQTSLDELDLKYFRKQLARPGYLALQDIKTNYAQSNPQLIVRIDSMYSDRNNGKGTNREQFLSIINVVSGDIPEQLGETIYENVSKNSWAMQNTRHYYVMPLDLNSDEQLEYLYVEERKSGRYLQLYYFENKRWNKANVHQNGAHDKSNKKSDEKFIEALKAGQYELSNPKWKDLKLGGQHFEIR